MLKFIAGVFLALFLWFVFYFAFGMLTVFGFPMIPYIGFIMFALASVISYKALT